MKKRLISFFLMMILLPSLLSYAVWAETFTEGTLYYTVEGDSVTITGYFGTAAEVYVPSRIAGNPVNAVAAGAFADNVFVQTVYLPDTVTVVESGAFGEGIQVNFNYDVNQTAVPAPAATASPNTSGNVTASPSPNVSASVTSSESGDTAQVEAENDKVEREQPVFEQNEDGTVLIATSENPVEYSDDIESPSVKKHAGGIAVLCVASVAVGAAVIVLKKRSVKKQ